jgi:hypothetical protein
MLFWQKLEATKAKNLACSQLSHRNFGKNRIIMNENYVNSKSGDVLEFFQPGKGL